MIVNSIEDKLFSQLTSIEIYKSLYNTAVKLKLPLALWKLPHQGKWQMLIGDEIEVLSNPQIENLSSGFIINGFESRGLAHSWYINRKFFYTGNVSKLGAELQTLGDAFKDDFISQLNKSELQHHSDYSILGSGKVESSNFKKIVAEAVESINYGNFQKVILSRKKEVTLPESFHPVEVLDELSQQYKNAFTSLISVPELGIWIGASPETLICVNDGIFRTCSLAGTQQFHSDMSLKEVRWSQKEIEEQALVSRYIINCFKKIRLREYLEEGPKTVQAGNLLHLRTDFSVNMREVDFPRLASDMLELLHPTSAVCGMPHDKAIDFILSHEEFKRELYAGYFGPVNIENSTNIFVNLRCMKVEGQKAFLFAGAGITEDSNPEKEWLETEMKFRTLLNVLN